MSALQMLYHVLLHAAGGAIAITSPIVITKNRAAGPGGANAGIAFQNDGSIDEVGPLLADRTSINAGEWWNDEPQANIGDEYEVRCTSVSVGSWDVQAAAVGTFVTISGELIWREVRTGGKGGEGTGSDRCVALFRIREIADTGNFVDFTVDATATKDP